MSTRREFLFGRGASGPVARILEGCLQGRGIVCGSCSDACDARALLRRPGLAPPLVDPARCTACGQCLTACPAGAIEVA